MGVWLAAKGFLFALCCVADAFVLRTAWTGRQVTEGQFRRGYFEPFDGEVGLAMDETIRPVFPAFLLTGRDELAVPPGVTAVAPLAPGATYDLARDTTLAPYVVIGEEAPVALPAHGQLLPGEARLARPRTLSLQDGRLALVAWDPTRPWREDAARLLALHDGCAALDGTLPLTVNVGDDGLRIHLGRCSVAEPLPVPSRPAPLLAALAGPEWLTVTRRPGWIAERWFLWPVLAAAVVKVAAMWWGFGPASAVATSGVLGLAAFWMPVPAMLTWPLVLIVGVLAAALRAAMLVLRQLPPRARVPVAVAVLALAGCAVAIKAREPDSFPPIQGSHAEHGEPDACAIIGYSAAGGESLRAASLRRDRVGLRSFLDEDCARCRDKTAGLTAGGETLAWARDAYCSSAPTFGAGGQVIFFGAANDDFLWGVLSMARLFIIGQQGIEPWRRNQAPAVAASLNRIDAQVSALQDLMHCVRSRSARFLFLHDFLVTDLVAGREPGRAAMLARRQAAVEAAGGTFVDLYQVFAGEAGISWFNDYVHPSLVAHERIAELACRQAP